MIYSRTRLYTDVTHQDDLYMGQTVQLDFDPEDPNEERFLFRRDTRSYLTAGLCISSISGHVFPPPIIKTVERLAHPDFTMGVLSEVLWYDVGMDTWIPYYAKTFLGPSRPSSIILTQGVREIYGSSLGFHPNSVDSTMIHGLWTVCGMDGNEYAQEGLSYFDKLVPYAGSIAKVWSDERDMIRLANQAVSALSRNRDCLSETMIRSITDQLYTPIWQVPIVLRSKDVIRKRYLGTSKLPIPQCFGMMREPSPVRIDRTIHTEKYDHRYRSVFYAIDTFPLTDMDILATIDYKGKLRGVEVKTAIDRYIAVMNGCCLDDILEGHVMYILDKLSECITGKYYAYGSTLKTLNELYGSNLLHVAIVKSPYEEIQIRIYDMEYRVCFAMTIPSAIVKLTDTTVTCCM